MTFKKKVREPGEDPELVKQPVQKWSDTDYQEWLSRRQGARCDLFFLSNDVLGYDWVCHKVHDEMIAFMPQMYGGADHFDFKTRRLMGYTPLYPIEELNKSELRNQLLLYPRGSLKTTVATVSEDVQWIINYPDIRIGLVTAIGEQGQGVFDEIRKKFQYCEKLRYLFPELCPQPKKAADWGNQESFTVLNRPRHRKEPTLSLLSPGKVIAGWHFDVLMFCDVVDWTTVQTPGQLAQTIKFCNYCEPLIERYRNGMGGWRMVEGTPYDYADYYGTIRDREEPKPESERQWKILVRSARNADGSLLWPERITEQMLAKIEGEDPFVAASQYYMNPVPSTGSLATKEQVLFTQAEILRRIQPMLNIYCTVDLAGMDDEARNAARNDDSVLNVGGWDNDGRLYVLEIDCGKFTPHQVIELMFSIKKRYPRLLAFKIEKDAHARVLKPFMKREMEKRGQWLPMVLIQRDNQKSKKQRIRGLQPWFQAGLIRFSDGISCKSELIAQVLRFSNVSRYHDDILDTLVDHCFSAEGEINYSVIPAAEYAPMEPKQPHERRFLGFDPTNGAPLWQGDAGKIDERYYDRMTGTI